MPAMHQTPIPDIDKSVPNVSGLQLHINPAPYPKVTGSHDPSTVAMLKQDYAGANGELSAITLYIFQNIATSTKETFANAMLRIAIMEMSHLHMLGEAIETLGGDMRFNNGRHYWSAANLDYSQTSEAMLQADIKAETIAIANYEKHAALTKNVSVRDLLLRIAEDEKLHLQFFERTLKNK